MEPGAGLLTVGAFLVHPEVGVRVDDPAFRDIEKLLGRDVEKSEVSEIKM